MASNNYLLQYQQRINTFLKQHLPAEDVVPMELHQAMRYVVLGGGKRIRAALVYAAAEDLGAPLQALNHVAAAVELIHAYSLVHDDLPAMDDDALRHGKATCHKAFNEATAILTGDALQALAFETLASAKQYLPATTCLEMFILLSRAIGSCGMVGGQALDLAAENQQINLNDLELIHKRKTGALISASVQLGAIAAGCKETERLIALESFAQTLGLAFQVQDDILDIESSTAILGKQQGADLAKNKATFPGLLGLPVAKAKLHDLWQDASHHLTAAGLQQSKLQQILQFIQQRSY